MNGRSSWFELPARDMMAAMSFYQDLFGWSFVPLRDPAAPDYFAIEAGGSWIGGIRPATGDDSLKQRCDAPLLYITVEALAEASKKAEALGGRLVGGRVQLAGERGAYQRFRDPADNLLALWAPEKRP